MLSTEFLSLLITSSHHSCQRSFRTKHEFFTQLALRVFPSSQGKKKKKRRWTDIAALVRFQRGRRRRRASNVFPLLKGNQSHVCTVYIPDRFDPSPFSACSSQAAPIPATEALQRSTSSHTERRKQKSCI
ncbi:hypothetical protein KP509_26G021900 [Ceratopteris richardii]|uniref:Uncharacterized protein n=1 Tax=Ceratopteris richardii TaxID=49495 RepID=A0A8T2RJ25_CERRI|nr:hypothetical protein KP509_26G021900 [Ceratopteris richardii]